MSVSEIGVSRRCVVIVVGVGLFYVVFSAFHFWGFSRQGLHPHVIWVVGRLGVAPLGG